MSELLLGWYGDDFTGSTDVMEALETCGIPAVLFIAEPTPAMLAQCPGVRAVGIAGRTRAMPTAEMAGVLDPALRALDALSPRIVHYKVCSTFDSSPEVGSIGRAIDIGQGIFRSPFVPVVVGAPVLGRYVVFGNLFARSGLDSEPYRLDCHPTMSRHPVTPMDEADVREILAGQTARAVTLIDVLRLNAEPEQLQADSEVVLFDTLTPDHLATIGRLLWQAMAEHRLYSVASSGLEYALGGYLQSSGEVTARTFEDPGPVAQIAVVSGSCSPVTARQIAWAEAAGFVSVPLDPRAIIADHGLRDTVIFAAMEALAAGRSVIFHTALGPDDPRLAGPELDQEDLGHALAEILDTLIGECGLKRVAVTGGDTSGRVARAMGLESLTMIGPMAPGSPLCRAMTGGRRQHLEGLEIVFKGGQVGRDRFFGDVLRGRPTE